MTTSSPHIRRLSALAFASLMLAHLPTMSASRHGGESTLQWECESLSTIQASCSQDVSRSLVESAKASITTAEYQVSRTELGLEAPNRAHNLRAFFEPWGVRLEDRSAEGGLELFRMRTTGIGRTDRMRPVGEGQLHESGTRVENRRDDGIVEWYENGEAGLEHGYVLDRRPAGEGELLIDVAFEGASVKVNHGSAVIETATDRQLFYSKLVVRDALGREVRSRLAGAGKGIVRLSAEDRGSEYPLVVDPILTSASDARLEADQVDALMGSSCAGAGDVNGDGFADVIVGAPLYDAGQMNEGAAFVFHGGPAGVSSGSPATANTTLESNQEFALLGTSVAGAGDVNGDGYADVIVGADAYDAGQDNEGAAFVFHGGPAGITSGGAATANAALESNQSGARLGRSVASAGDVNGDGYGDVIVGSWAYNSEDGAAFVFHGGTAGVSSGGPATANATFESNQTEAWMGWSVAGAGDVNGDGFADVIVGARNYDAGQSGEGAAFVFHGGPAGIASGNPSTANATLESDQSGAILSESVAGAGDVNGDGFADVIVGALFYSSGQSGEGAAFVFHGGAAGVSSGNPATSNATLESNQTNGGMGFAVAGAGDVNGDGFADVIVGAKDYNAGQPSEGAAFLYHGSTTGVSSGNPATANASVESNQDGAWMGHSVAAAGDVNGDGFADVIVGSRFYDAPQASEGAAFVFHGDPAGIAPVGTDTVGIYVAATGSWFLRNANSPGAADLVFGYGPANLGWIALRGDWDGNGTDTAGLYDPVNGNFFLKNTNAPGVADLVYGFGPAGFGWKPLVGDWNSDGVDTVGLYDPASGFFFLRNIHAPGAADLVYGFGPAGLGWEPMVGDWDGNGTDTVGLYDPATGNFFLRNSHSGGGADFVYGFGPAGVGWNPVAGDWNGDRHDTIGLYDPGMGNFFLRNSHSPGPADLVFGYGPANTTPIPGDWDGQ